jgi:hypothetical protein
VFGAATWQFAQPCFACFGASDASTISLPKAKENTAQSLSKIQPNIGKGAFVFNIFQDPFYKATVAC